MKIKPMDYRKILQIIAEAAVKKETVEIYYPKTDTTKEGWREIEPYFLSNDTTEDAEHLIYEQDRLSPGHILNARTVGDKDEFCHYFIIGKIKKARKTGKSFSLKKNWQVEF
ncbi:MAG: hypothetical protein PHH17_01630 [Candidatus Pacebacteria bacterium]|jgi:hypothetical protein|nr:hypothetical protein [Candidatus Paceibacterota bacterium]MDD3072386.1 hypothetical protein [Candidatus Paceibacterota bacterium]MDD3728999.1 hypothetical protein [Candidatus Paceibacterota bacterium]MDD4201630.1 hypothetical protein [Candidatus Paceibacterota bacterium]MDD4467227.1 hypothetical protein [Candidatus Paceibacterota bacterium]